MQTAERWRPRCRRFIRLSSLETVPEASRKGSDVLGRLWYVGSCKRTRVGGFVQLCNKRNIVEERSAQRSFYPTSTEQLLTVFIFFRLISYLLCKEEAKNLKFYNFLSVIFFILYNSEIS